MPLFEIQFSGLDTKAFEALKIDTRGLPSRFRERLPAEVNEASFFSAKVSDARFLNSMKEYISRAARGESGYHRDDFIKKMHRELGIERGEFGDAMTDISSIQRLTLIYEHQIAKMAARAQYARSLTRLDVFPAQELIRAQIRKEPRNWVRRWKEAGGKFYKGRMIAPVLSDIWVHISRFGTPYPPFDFNSGMGLRAVSAREAVRLGVVSKEYIREIEDAQKPREAEAVAPAEKPTGVAKEKAKPAAEVKPKKEKPIEPPSVDDLPDVNNGSSANLLSIDFSAGVLLLGVLFKRFGSKVAVSSENVSVVFVGDVGVNVERAMRSASYGTDFEVQGVSPETTRVETPSAAARAIGRYSRFVFDGAMLSERARICALVVSSPTEVRYSEAGKRFIFSKRCGDTTEYAIAKPIDGRTLFVSSAQKTINLGSRVSH